VREIASEIMAAHSDQTAERVVALFAGERGYATPKVDGRGVVFDAQGRILLVRELRDGGWTLPGGFADVGDSPSQAVEREVREESGYEVKAVKLLALYDRSRHGPVPARPWHIYKIFLRCELTGGSPRDSHETAGARFFCEDEIPELSPGRTKPGQLARMFEHYRRPDLPADFDELRPRARPAVR
jgi:ADP-ribose pyrophosphatase YjhB (NUDIX family)